MRVVYCTRRPPDAWFTRVCIGLMHAGDDHWSFRMHTARCLAALADRFPATELEVRARIARVCEKILEKAASDRAASGHLAACFGAAVGLQAMGMQLVRMLLLPALPAVMRMLLPCMNRVRLFSQFSFNGTRL